MNCKNCNIEIDSKYCPDCGLSTQLKRIDGHYIIHEIEHVLHFERGILHTIKELLINPGQNVRNYLTDNRTRLVKPIIFIILTSLAYTLAINYFHIEDRYITFQVDKDGTELVTSAKIFDWIASHYGYTNIMMGIFTTLWLKLFFRKSPYNIFEILILLCFVMGISMLIFALFAIIQGLTSLKIMVIGGMLGIGYSSWATGQFFGKGKIVNYFKAFSASMLGMISFAGSAIFLGFAIDYILKL